MKMKAMKTSRNSMAKTFKKAMKTTKKAVDPMKAMKMMKGQAMATMKKQVAKPVSLLRHLKVFCTKAGCKSSVLATSTEKITGWKAKLAWLLVSWEEWDWAAMGRQVTYRKRHFTNQIPKDGKP